MHLRSLPSPEISPSDASLLPARSVGQGKSQIHCTLKRWSSSTIASLQGTRSSGMQLEHFQSFLLVLLVLLVTFVYCFRIPFTCLDHQIHGFSVCLPDSCTSSVAPQMTEKDLVEKKKSVHAAYSECAKCLIPTRKKHFWKGKKTRLKHRIQTSQHLSKLHASAHLFTRKIRGGGSQRARQVFDPCPEWVIFSR